MIKTKYILSVILLFSLLTLIQAIDFNSSILDPGQVHSTPGLKIGHDGTKHIVYSTGNSLIHINSKDDFNEKFVISDTFSDYNNVNIAIDSNEVIHVVFGTACGGTTYYVNSLNWSNVIPLQMNSCGETLDIDIDKNGRLIIVGQHAIPTGTYDIIIATSNDFNNFNYQRIEKIANQMSPRIALDSDNNIHLVYWDWSDGIGEYEGQPMALYKLRYRNSLDNFTVEENISIANQSHNGDIAVDSNNDIWVIYKSTLYNYIDGEALTYGDVILTDKDSSWAVTRITNESIFYMADRPASIAIDKNNAKHFTWNEWKNRSEENEYINVMYGKHNSPTVITLQDVSYEEQLGWASIDIDENDNPYIAANIHSLAEYFQTTEENQTENNFTNCSCCEELELLKTRVTILENKTNTLERFMNAVLSWSSDFLSYWTSPDKCTNNQMRCGGTGTQKCINYRWVNQVTCLNGCTNGVCNKENCSAIPQTYSCAYSNRYSKTNLFKCTYRQGTDTSCNPGKCQASSYLQYCGNGCDILTGKCK